MNPTPNSEEKSSRSDAPQAVIHSSPNDVALRSAAADGPAAGIHQTEGQDHRLAEVMTELAEAKAVVEEQRKELAIEAALEEVRSRSLAMAGADELDEVVTVVLQKLYEMNVVTKDGFPFVAVFDDNAKEITEWVTSPEHSRALRFTTKCFDHPVSLSIWEERESGEDFVVRSFSDKDKRSYFQYRFQNIGCNGELDHIKDLVAKGSQYGYAMAFEKKLALGVSIFGQPTLSQKEGDILKRFARVFEQAYIRFLELQNVEAQAKEARVETALERLRSRTMAMQSSRDVGDAIGLLFTELEQLDIITLRCGVFIIDPDTETMEVWTATSTPEGKIGQGGGRFPMKIHPMLQNALNAWRTKETFYSYTLANEELTNYFKILLATNPGYTLPTQSVKVTKQVSSGFFFTEGALFTFTPEPHTDQNIVILKRFATVFGLTYRRFLDLKATEEQNLQTVKQASLDRLRAEIASMRFAADLNRITPLLWHELTVLRVRFTRCGFFIIEEETGRIHAYLSTPQGASRGLLNMLIEENEHTRTLFAKWRDQVVYTDSWNKEQLLTWLKYMNTLNRLGETESRRSEEDLPEQLYLHFVPFTQGMLYVGNSEALTNEELESVKSLAEAFAIAYARYEDFKGLEIAKNKLEVTLRELKATQRQLIDSEKMASLGELTAGIAHEIQNPLNFVNNFSEVSTELLSEIEEAIKSGEIKAIPSLVADIKENMQKIAHHGRRAEAIVKAMLLHSRASQAEKMLTDVNLLADEYLRLSYHGLRAKDKAFNAKFVTEFDPAITKIILAPQDIGRALLNLFNNAFYAVNEKKKRLGAGFDPVVIVTTKEQENAVEIRVKDNGMGIPQRLLDKIFQPFFTTKPSGQGTGLGLSLSYDIISAHGGELSVETTEGEGTVFKIILPAKTN